MFEDRVERALSKLGVYTQNDVQRLVKRVDVLSEAVNELIKATGVTPAHRSAPKAVPKRRKVKGAVPKVAKPATKAARK